MKTTHSNSRRDFMKFVGVSSLFAVTPSMAEDTTIPHIVVVGGGFSGATCAKYLKMWGGSSVKVTIIEANSTYVSPILSNLVLNGQKTTSELSFTYGDLNSKYSINMIHSIVSSVDKTNQSLTLENGDIVKYDKLVLAAGIDFIPLESAYDITKVPHAWKAGEQTNLLKAQIDAMGDGDTFTMTIPAAPYRCPPGPYERACVVADYLKNTKGFTNCKVTVLDANANITVEADTFGAKFLEYGVVYKPSTTVTHVDDVNKVLTYTEGGVEATISATVLNVIPNQKAAPIVFTTGVNSGNWAPINPLSYESILTSGIYIIGDSQGTGQPKAGHIGNSEAKVCADAILRTLNGVALYASPKTNSACYSPTSATEASWLTGVFEYDNSTNTMVGVASSMAAGPSASENYSKMFLWSENLFSDTFA